LAIELRKSLSAADTDRISVGRTRQEITTAALESIVAPTNAAQSALELGRCEQRIGFQLLGLPVLDREPVLRIKVRNMYSVLEALGKVGLGLGLGLNEPHRVAPDPVRTEHGLNLISAFVYPNAGHSSAPKGAELQRFIRPAPRLRLVGYSAAIRMRRISSRLPLRTSALR
jgi:hypothetical protein